MGGGREAGKGADKVYLGLTHVVGQLKPTASYSGYPPIKSNSKKRSGRQALTNLVMGYHTSHPLFSGPILPFYKSLPLP